MISTYHRVGISQTPTIYHLKHRSTSQLYYIEMIRNRGNPFMYHKQVVADIKKYSILNVDNCFSARYPYFKRKQKKKIRTNLVLDVHHILHDQPELCLPRWRRLTALAWLIQSVEHTQLAAAAEQRQQLQQQHRQPERSRLLFKAKSDVEVVGLIVFFNFLELYFDFKTNNSRFELSQAVSEPISF